MKSGVIPFIYKKMSYRCSMAADRFFPSVSAPVSAAEGTGKFG
jgi:hypothetical protein